MSRRSKILKSLLAGFLLAAPLFAAFAADQPGAPSTAAHRRRARKKPALVLPPLPAGPLRQVPMDQLPATAPQVTYRNGLLSIAAQNSTLGEILREVRQLTGAAIELPANGGTERVVTQLGPGAPRDVLAHLLNGTAFNYVMAGTTSDPNAVATVVLTPKPAGGEVQTAVNYQPEPNANPNPMPPPMPFRPGVVAAAPQTATVESDDNTDDADAEDKDDEDNADESQPAQPGVGMVQPEGTGPNGGPMSPEQILQRLRQGQQPPQGYPQPPQPQPQQEQQ